MRGRSELMRWSGWRHRLLREAGAIRSAVGRSRMIQTGAVIRRRVVAHGLVQGVFFRDTCRRQAWAQRVAGWVTNREDGAVEAVFEGEPSAVQAMVEWARKGPPHAYVNKLEVIEEEPRGERGFSVR
jgi:acylphosphatase